MAKKNKNKNLNKVVHKELADMARLASRLELVLNEIRSNLQQANMALNSTSFREDIRQLEAIINKQPDN